LRSCAAILIKRSPHSGLEPEFTPMRVWQASPSSERMLKSCGGASSNHMFGQLVNRSHLELPVSSEANNRKVRSNHQQINAVRATRRCSGRRKRKQSVKYQVNYREENTKDNMSKKTNNNCPNKIDKDQAESSSSGKTNMADSSKASTSGVQLMLLLSALGCLLLGWQPAAAQTQQVALPKLGGCKVKCVNQTFDAFI